MIVLIPAKRNDHGNKQSSQCETGVVVGFTYLYMYLQHTYNIMTQGVPISKISKQPRGCPKDPHTPL